MEFVGDHIFINTVTDYDDETTQPVIRSSIILLLHARIHQNRFDLSKVNDDYDYYRF